MVSFKYALNQDFVELQASNWCGLERVFVNGKMVSSKLNFGQNSEHSVKLHDGNPCRFQLLIDPTSEEMVCRIYKRGNLITSINQGKENLHQSRKLLQNLIIFTTMLSLTALMMN